MIPRFQSSVWVCALFLANFVILYNLGYAIDEISFKSLLFGIIINAVCLIFFFGGIEVYKSYYFSGFPYM